ncbi:MAG: nucleotidyltransferase domain-containing protein [Candidatus Zixiibacteriota bacterium]
MTLQKINPRPITESMISEIVTKIVENFHPEKIMLFGSQVWGRPKDWSDLDLLVIMNFNEPSSQLSAKISIVAKPHLVPMDILVRTPDEIKRRIEIGDYFIQRILTKGKVLYERAVS